MEAARRTVARKDNLFVCHKELNDLAVVAGDLRGANSYGTAKVRISLHTAKQRGGRETYLLKIKSDLFQTTRNFV